MSEKRPYVQQWVTVHPQDMSEFVRRENAAGWAVLAVVAMPGSHALGVLTGPAPSPARTRSGEAT